MLLPVPPWEAYPAASHPSDAAEWSASAAKHVAWTAFSGFMDLGLSL